MSDPGKSKIDLAQLIKILNLTQSDSDGEALNALRLANSKIKAAGLTWENLLSTQPKTEYKRQYKWKEAPRNFSAGFFKGCVNKKEFISVLSTDQRKWVNNLIDFYNDHQYLPEKTWTNFRDLWHNFREADRE
jgi:hypothetical protein